MENMIKELKKITIPLNEITETRNLEKEITKIVKDKKISKNGEIFLNLLNNNECDLDLKYKCFFALISYNRYHNDYIHIEENLKSFIGEFDHSNYASITHLEFLAKLILVKYKQIDNHEALTLLRRVQKFIENLESKYSNNKFLIGTKHLYTDLFLTIYEHDNKLKNELNEYLKIANDYLADAILGDSKYAKFYCTRARLHMYNLNYENALYDINYAISKENIDSEQYQIKLLEYTSVKNLIIIREAQEEIENRNQVLIEELNKQKEEMKSSTIKNIEIVGFFAGVISFVIASLQMGDNLTFKESAYLIVIMLGAWTLCYTAFSYLLNNGNSENKKKTIVVLLFSLFLIIGGIIFGAYFHM